MKQLSTFLLCLMMVQLAWAQQTEPADSTKTDEDETYSIGDPPSREGEDGESVVVEFKLGNTDTTKNVITRWITLGLGVNEVLDGDNIVAQDLQDDWDLKTFKSTNVDLGIVQWKFNVIDHSLYLNSGLGLDINKYMFEEDFWIDPDAENWVTDYDILDGIDTKKNRLTATYLHLPLMLNFESSNDHYDSFRLSAGGFGGLRIGSNQKIKFEDKDDNPFEDDKKKYKEKNNYNLNNFTYGLKAEIGYGPVNLYGKYHLQEIFEEDSASPRLNNLSIGLMLVPF